MTKILGVVGSPRKNGNTHILVSKILEGANEVGATSDTLLLGDKNIKECNGCHVCWQGKQCSKRDDMNEIYPKIFDADIIIFGTPVYWYGPTALMKAFVDRFVFFNSPVNRNKIKGKSAVLVIPYEEKNPDTAAPLITFFEKSLDYLEMNIKGKIIVPGVTVKGEVKEKPAILDEAFTLGKKLINSLNKL